MLPAVRIARPHLNGHSRDKQLRVQIRRPKPQDGSAIWQLVQRSESLEENSCYAYLLLGSHFADTSLVAELEGRIIAFVWAYRPPTDLQTVFVWQIGVDATLRGQGVANAMLHALIQCPGCDGVEYLEATVGSSNSASKRLFDGLARDLGATCAVTTGFSSGLFSPLQHESEDLLRIGPINPEKTMKLERPHGTL